MATICPTVTAFDLEQFKAQAHLLEGFAKRVHVDLMDGEFAPTSSPPLTELPKLKGVIVDLHVMYQRPMEHIEELLALEPSLIIIHQEADVDHAEFARKLHEAGVKAGIAVLQQTEVAACKAVLPEFEHFLVFSGNLGYHGGSKTDLGLLKKADEAKAVNPTLEIGWDGGINDEVAPNLVRGGVEVLNTGGFIHKAPSPQDAYANLQALVDSV